MLYMDPELNLIINTYIAVTPVLAVKSNKV